MADEGKYDTDSDEDIGDENAWDECEVDPTPTTCLFCSVVLESPDVVFSHCESDHKVNIKTIVKRWNLDCFGYIKLVNYIRSQRPEAATINLMPTDGKPPWDSDDFMRPVDPTDEMLQYDIEDLETLAIQDNKDEAGDRRVACNGGDSKTVVLTEDEYQSLLMRLQTAEDRVNVAEENLQRAVTDIESMKKVSRELMLSQPVEINPTVSDITEDVDEDYFSSYGHFGIHEEMLKDKVRTESYRDFMYQNKDVFHDKVVLDVGCGTGILSMFAVKAGAKHVYAVDMAEIIYSAMDIARENNMADKITFIKGKLEDITLPVDKVDIILSEWMGYFLLFESMLDSILFARAKFLKHDGAVYPDRCNISLAAVSDPDLHDKHVNYWNNVYGFKMSCMKTCVVREASVKAVDKTKIVTDSCVIKDIDVCSCGIDDLQFTSEFSLTVRKDGSITAFVGYFDMFFEKLALQKVSFSTSPEATTTHWKQTVFMLDTPLQCSKGDILTGTLSCKKSRKDPRALIITIKMKDNLLTYHME